MKVILCKCTKCATLVPAMTRFPEKLWMEGREGARGGAADLPTSSEYLVILVPGIQISALCCVLTTNNYLIIHCIHLGKYICLDKQILFVFCVCSVYKARSERGGAIITYSIVKIIHYLEGSCFSYLQNMCAIFVKAGFMGRCEDVVRAQSLICRHRYFDNIFG